MDLKKIFSTEEVSRELAGQYHDGHLTMDEYLTMWEEIAASQGKEAVK